MAAQPLSIRRAAAESVDTSGVVVGSLIEVQDGIPRVRFAGGAATGVIAKVATSDPALAEGKDLAGVKVLLAFENGDLTLPVIVGVVRDRLPSVSSQRPAAHALGEKGQSLNVNGKTLVFEGQEEIVFRCGQGSITLRADGAIIVKGTRLLSRASETNKIRGASVQIN